MTTTRRAFIGAILIATTLAGYGTQSLHATSCSNEIPPGYYVTPDCTWIVAQVDPGIWLDNVGQCWGWQSGSSMPVHVGCP